MVKRERQSGQRRKKDPTLFNLEECTLKIKHRYVKPKRMRKIKYETLIIKRMNWLYQYQITRTSGQGIVLEIKREFLKIPFKFKLL